MASSSPTKDAFQFPTLAPPNHSSLNPPASPRRALRRLQSAHTLGSSFNQPSLISQQHKQALQKIIPPVPKDAAQSSTTTHSRARSNSDVTNIVPVPTSSMRRPTSNRKLTATESVKSDSDGMSSLRIYIWLILLNAPTLETDAYLSLIHRGASPAYSKIRNDTFRTLATDPLFRRRVSEASLIRLLNAVAWRLHDAKEARAEYRNIQNRQIMEAAIQGSPERNPSSPSMRSRARALTLTTEGSDVGAGEPGTYVQGMNVLAAPFLYAARSESEAFAAFHRFITTEVPGYVRGAMDGVHKGLALVDKVLAIVDPKLSLYLIGKGMSAEIYAFPSVLTLCACTPPLPEVLRLWDFLFAYGAHLNILCIVAQLVILRHSIMSSPSPTKILRSFPPLQADTIKEVTLTIIKKIPDDVYAEIVSHAK
ncbi:mitotic check point protein [Botrytis cinerea]